MSQIYEVVVPQVNVNDDTVLFGEWLVQRGAAVRPGLPLCSVETSKAVTEVEAEHAGVLLPLAQPQSLLKVGARIALIGEDLPSLEEWAARSLASPTASGTAGAPASPAGPTPGRVRATPLARALAAEKGVSLEEIAASGVAGAIKESDVENYLKSRTTAAVAPQVPEPKADLSTGVPPNLGAHIEDRGPLSRHELGVRHNLRASVQNALLTTMEVDFDATEAVALLDRLQREGRLVSLLHLVVFALGRTLPQFGRMKSFHVNNRIFEYRSDDIAFVMRSREGKLFTPVVRDVGALSVADVARACQGAAMRINRGRTRPEDLEGACFTVSHVGLPSIVRFVALPQSFQSAILAVAGERREYHRHGDTFVERVLVSLTLTYDHTLCDGIYAADFLTALLRELSEVTV